MTERITVAVTDDGEGGRTAKYDGDFERAVYWDSDRASEYGLSEGEVSIVPETE